MGALRKEPPVKAEVISDPSIMSGNPVIRGTRILADTIVSYLRADFSPQAIFAEYPSLPVDGIDAGGADLRRRLEDRGVAIGRRLTRFLIDECLSGLLVAAEKARGYDADYVPFIGKGGWQDWNLMPFAIANDYIFVTLNRRDFLKQNANLDIHPGLVILIPQEPENRGVHQVKLFERALEAFAVMNHDLVNKIMEVLADGSVHVRAWSSEHHDIGHIDHPGWR